MQIQQRVQHDIKKILPTIHGLSVLVSGSANLSRTEDMDEFEDALATLSRDLLQALPSRGHAEPSRSLQSPQQIVSTQTPTQPSLRSLPFKRNAGKRERPTGLRPPSPEARQKRKTSYGYY